MFVFYVAALAIAVHLSERRRITLPSNHGLQQMPPSLSFGRRS